MRVGRDRGAASLLPPGGIRSGTGNGLCACQGKIESSAFQQSRKFRFLASPRGGRGNLASSAEGSRPRRRGKAEATESAPKAIGTSPPRSVGNRAEGFPVQDASRRGEGLRSEAEALHFREPRCFGEILERRLLAEVMAHQRDKFLEKIPSQLIKVQEASFYYQVWLREWADYEPLGM